MNEHSRGGVGALAFGTLGIVFGDIGTSPIYAFRESFEHSGLAVDAHNAYGVASVVFWSLIVVISLKYLFLVMRADNHGEGGILALTALVMPAPGQSPTRIGAAVNTRAIPAVPRRCTANNPTRMTTDTGITHAENAEVATSNPSTADRTEIAGVINPSPYSNAVPKTPSVITAAPMRVGD